MTQETVMLILLATLAVVVIVVLVMVRRFRTMLETNQRIEENQRRAVELSERQTVALERLADAAEAGRGP
ncbi:hypothetical protein HKCCE2091_06245 [Rhodobacterales bacterium HKCCE2091]|nr:hypothetical protein [Rhodobacterales bacterium HKCCE2091]